MFSALVDSSLRLQDCDRSALVLAGLHDCGDCLVDLLAHGQQAFFDEAFDFMADFISLAFSFIFVFMDSPFSCFMVAPYPIGIGLFHRETVNPSNVALALPPVVLRRR